MRYTLLVKKQEKYFKLQIRPFVDGIRRIKYALLELHPTYEDIISKTYTPLWTAVVILIAKRKSVTVEFLPKSKWTTLNDKKIFSKPNFLTTSWLQILVRGLIGKGRDLKPFWNKQCKEISEKLWLPTETDYVGSHLNFWNGSSVPMESNSWFSINRLQNPQTQNSPMTFSPLYKFIHAGKWEEEGIRSRKIRIYPTKQQKQLLRQWMGTRRFVYNRVLAAVKQGEKKNFFQLRNKYVTSKNNPNVEEWQKSTPKDIRAGAIRDLMKSYKTLFSQLKSCQINKFQLKFSSKKDSPSIEIPKSAIKIKDGLLCLYSTYLSNTIKMHKKSKLLEVNYDCRLQFKHGKWFLVVPTAIKVKKPHNRQPYCAIDPGVRSFQTVYSEYQCIQIKHRREILSKLQTKIDLFRSLRARKIIKRKSLKQRERKLQFRMSNLIDDLHHKTASFLTKTFDHIILPSFESQDMSRKIKNKKVNRDLMQLQHFKFKQRLIAKCHLNHSTIDICTEEYTSKTCGRCGKLNDVGSKDVYSCNFCLLTIDRDINGARNIAIKRLV